MVMIFPPTVQLLGFTSPQQIGKQSEAETNMKQGKRLDTR